MTIFWSRAAPPLVEEHVLKQLGLCNEVVALDGGPVNMPSNR
ncbi:hypothetical protein [Xylella fastidiosa]|nr:hypothetical protein [Xylella fastidiosa]ADN63386.1 hypothetical protein XFLM_07360 [Xylella fastidiosa subsp. fastidiosa GB514]KAF0572204.1 hypothetical protein P305_01430 [Xylella fastidiosa subsp. fastidiosa Mus-1]AIC13528.1 hypothetical protein P303_01435 [Xylella fastidiosa MUL0034]MDC7963006.1 hypothetical protein [Xylella fastidiosa]WCF14364.1 hypothetical protein OK115_07895 [Xylella fastidiosa subsp. fastidiosa]